MHIRVEDFARFSTRSGILSWILLRVTCSASAAQFERIVLRVEVWTRLGTLSCTDAKFLEVILAEKPNTLESSQLEYQLDRLRQTFLELGIRETVTLEFSLDDDSLWLSTKKALLAKCVHEADMSEWKAGAVFCVQCLSSTCEHALPPSRDAVFHRYTPNGKPVFRPLQDILLEQSPVLGEQLYRGPRKLVDFLCVKPQDEDPLLSEVRKRTSMTIEAVLYLGFLRSERLNAEERVAVSILLLRDGSRFRLHQVGLKQTLFDRLAELADDDHIKALDQSMRFAGRKLKRMARQHKAGVADQKMSPVTVLKQLGTAMRRISMKHRTRTKHAKRRHAEGGRPTGEALKDALRVGAPSLLFDERRQTWVVIGRRGRAHLFAPAGKHVTSIRLETGEVQRKRTVVVGAPSTRLPLSAFELFSKLDDDKNDQENSRILHYGDRIMCIGDSGLSASRSNVVRPTR